MCAVWPLTIALARVARRASTICATTRRSLATSNPCRTPSPNNPAAMPINRMTTSISSRVKPRWAMGGLFPVAQIGTVALAAGLAVLAVEDQVEGAVLTGEAIAKPMAERVFQLRRLGVGPAQLDALAGLSSSCCRLLGGAPTSRA